MRSVFSRERINVRRKNFSPRYQRHDLFTESSYILIRIPASSGGIHIDIKRHVSLVLITRFMLVCQFFDEFKSVYRRFVPIIDHIHGRIYTVISRIGRFFTVHARAHIHDGFQTDFFAETENIFVILRPLGRKILIDKNMCKSHFLCHAIIFQGIHWRIPTADHHLFIVGIFRKCVQSARIFTGGKTARRSRSEHHRKNE